MSLVAAMSRGTREGHDLAPAGSRWKEVEPPVPVASATFTPEELIAMARTDGLVRAGDAAHEP